VVVGVGYAGRLRSASRPCWSDPGAGVHVVPGRRFAIESHSIGGRPAVRLVGRSGGVERMAASSLGNQRPTLDAAVVGQFESA